MTKINRRILIILCLFVCLCSCEKKKKPIYFDTTYTEELESCDIIKIPYEEYGGVKYIKVKLYGLNLDMIVDSGSSLTLISKAEFNYLLQKGYLTENNIIGTHTAMIADGTTVENTRIILDEIVIGENLSCKNIEASVSENVSAPLLLGNEVLDRVASYTIDNVNKIIEFKLK